VLSEQYRQGRDDGGSKNGNDLQAAQTRGMMFDRPCSSSRQNFTSLPLHPAGRSRGALLRHAGTASHGSL